jgi:hypothetical protein
MTDRHIRLVGLYAALAALAAAVVSPLLALAYLSTSQGGNDIDSAPVSWWASPILRHAGSLVTWHTPDRAYATYTQALALLFPAVLLCALTARRCRGSVSRGEQWGWRVALGGYWLACLGLLAASVTLVPGHADSPALNAVFVAVLLPAMVLSVIGSTMLGIALLRGRYRPRVAAWLLALAIPLLAAGNILGHNSLGMLPLMIAWGLTGYSLRSDIAARHRAPLTAAVTESAR